MPAIRMTDRGLRALGGRGRRVDYYDVAFPAFIVRLGESGSRTFFFRYRGREGRYRRYRIGTYPALSLAEARDQARALEMEVGRGDDPGGTRQLFREGITFAKLADQYLDRYAKRSKQSWAEDERILRRDVLPKWGPLKPGEIHKRDVVALLESMADRGAPVMANRTLALLRKIFNWAAEVDLAEGNPCSNVRKVVEETPRSRVLSEDEIGRVWRALQREHPVTAAVFRLLLLTGQRSKEVLGLEWEHIEGNVWTIPAELAKSGRPQVVPLSEPAQRVIASLKGRSETWVLPSPWSGDGYYSKSLGHAAKRISERAGTSHWTPHDLRRTVATRMAELGIDEFVVARVLGHAYNSVTAIYNRYSYLAEKQDAMGRWGRRLVEIVSREGASE